MLAIKIITTPAHTKKAAARARKHRAKKSTGRKRGRPKSEGIPAWQAAGFNSRSTYQRHKRREAQNDTKNASRHLSKNKKRDGISVSHVNAPTPISTDAIKPPSFNLAAFGITAIQIRRGPDILSTWSRP
ncbi:hypothetical protein AC629_38690 [Bradyrhizobium sp. NAS80.1]|uniref:hypothetical protein n=1 Tax=Bradyrhizobium sp. NAS80.1 TaxID=1680159 RepID=UPI000960859C|nr:hypothetical protein [Bradyrhizobium sp. NAS80.1]OKO72010.1 hypothetical protein AC629_38690 [Bradyrhizobium sp. NAS80.1]